jgi:predicted Zn-dependent peptidase
VAGRPATRRFEANTMNESPYRKTLLASGITVLTETLPERRTFSFGAWARHGARDEPSDSLGISHLLEHMIFKGTERRDAKAIAQSLESLGGHLDAFTSREQVCFYARALSEHDAEVVDVVADIVCRSRLAQPEFDREKSVVRDEILAYDDNPDEKINDMLAEQVWGEHGLGRPILGTADTVGAITPEALRAHFVSRYQPSQFVISAVGGVDHERLCRLVEAHFALPDDAAWERSGPPLVFRPTVRHVEQDLQQLYVSLATRGLPFRDPEHETLVILSTLLGGGMSSRLFQSVREEAGLAYSIYSVPDFYRDGGMFSIHLGVSPERGREALARVRQELIRLRDDGPDEAEVAAARAQLKGGIVMEQESVSARQMQLAHGEVYRGRYMPMNEQVERIMGVTRDGVAAMARRLLAPEGFALAVLGPVPGGPFTEADWPVADAAILPVGAGSAPTNS